MPLKLVPAEPLPPFTFSPPPPSPPSDALAARPPADFLPARDMTMFGPLPLKSQGEEGRGLVKCLRCGRVSMEWAAAEHKRICAHVLDGTPLTVKKSKSVDTKKRRASEAVSNESTSPSKKRLKMPVDEQDSTVSTKGLKKSEIKKIQKEQARLEKKAAKEQEKAAIAERKRQRATNPLDLDRQCGVINDKGLPCSRSLTCKTHTVGAKRAVEGRTRPYDLLYLEWQRANNPNFKEPPTKKDKEARKAERAKDRAAAAAVQKKKKNDWDEDDYNGEDAQRELEELVHIARMAGERISGGGGGAGIKGAWFGISGIGMGGVGRVGGVWRAANWEFAQVGEMFTKALSARKGPGGQGPMGGGQAAAALPLPKISINAGNTPSIPNQAISNNVTGNNTSNPGMPHSLNATNGMDSMAGSQGINQNAVNGSNAMNGGPAGMSLNLGGINANPMSGFNGMNIPVAMQGRMGGMPGMPGMGNMAGGPQMGMPQGQMAQMAQMGQMGQMGGFGGANGLQGVQGLNMPMTQQQLELFAQHQQQQLQQQAQQYSVPV